MSAASFIRARLKKLEETMNTMAHDLAGGARDYDSYLLGVGRYRQMKSERDTWKETLQRMRAADDDAALEPGGETVIDDEEENPVTPAPPARRQKPRSWGGR